MRKKKKHITSEEAEAQERSLQEMSQDEFDKEIGFMDFSRDAKLLTRQQQITLLKRLGHIHCSYREMSAVTGVSELVLRAQFNDIIEDAKQAGKISLKRRMWKAAMEEGNVPMMIFLAKNMLGYFDDPIKKEEALQRSITRMSDEDLERKLQAVIELKKNAEGTHE